MRFITRFLARRALQRGVFGGSQAWLAVAGVIYVRRFVKRLAGGPEVLYCEELGPRDTLVITPVADKPE